MRGLYITQTNREIKCRLSRIDQNVQYTGKTIVTFHGIQDSAGILYR